MAGKGGKRLGAGRKPGSKMLTLRDYLSKKDIDTFVEYLLANYMEDSRLMVWLGEHLFGKAPQAIDLTSGGDKLPTPIMYVPGDDSNS
jgi:hypothetical protein